MYADPANLGNTAKALHMSVIWWLGEYFRISKDDEKAGESASIINQRADKWFYKTDGGI